MLVTQAYRFELGPNNKCRSALASHVGAARFAYNWGLSLVSNYLAARRALVVLAIQQGARREARVLGRWPARPAAIGPAGA